MDGNRRAQLFALDLMLAMIPITIIIGISATAMAGVTTQMHEYMYSYSLQRITLDATDMLIRTPGDPPNWQDNTSTLKTLGLTTNVTWTTTDNLLDLEKIIALNNSIESTEVNDSLKFLSGGNNIRISLYVNLDGDDITNVSAEGMSNVLDIAGYWENGVWTTTNSSTTIDGIISANRDIYLHNRLGFIKDPTYGDEPITGLVNFSLNSLNISAWDPINGTFTLDDLSDDFDYFVFINYTDGVPGGTPNSFKDILVNDIEFTTVYSYPSMNLKTENYQIEASDSGLWVPLNFSSLNETNNVTLALSGDADLGFTGTVLVLHKDIPLSDIPGWISLYIKLQYKKVLVKVVIWK